MVFKRIISNYNIWNTREGFKELVVKGNEVILFLNVLELHKLADRNKLLFWNISENLLS
jgi:hypothetical protein